MKILIIDNYDSFTFNLYQYLAEVSKSIPEVFYNDKISYSEIENMKPDAIVISPGPGTPSKRLDFGIATEILKKTTVPTLGVCLGHQGIAAIAGAKIIEASEIMHGRASKIYHNDESLFKTIPQGFAAIRYHSLVIDPNTLPSSIQTIAWTKDKTIMGIKHRTKPLWGVQFHPESIGTEYGKLLLENFLQQTKQQ